MGLIERQIAEQKLGYIADPPLLPCPFCGHVARLLHDTHSDYERQWSWGVECQNYGECEASLTGFAGKEAAIAKWNSRLVTYTHRNGETEAPTECGKYWFRGKIIRDQLGAYYCQTVILVDDIGPRLPATRWGETALFVGQWWGPVVAPWGQGA